MAAKGIERSLANPSQLSTSDFDFEKNIDQLWFSHSLVEEEEKPNNLVTTSFGAYLDENLASLTSLC